MAAVPTDANDIWQRISWDEALDDHRFTLPRDFG